MKPKTLAILLIAAFIVTTLMACNPIDKVGYMVLYPFKAVSTTPPEGVIEKKLTSGNDVTNVWIGNTKKDCTIVYFHGNGENLEQSISILNNIATMCNWVSYDYPGAGESTGKPSEATLTASGMAAYKLAKESFPNTRMIIWGRSIGSGVAMQTMKKLIEEKAEPTKLILTSALTTAMAIAMDKNSAFKHASDEFKAANTYDSLSVAKLVSVPVLQHHGDKDTLIPFKFGEELSRNFMKVKFVKLEGYEHNDIFMSKQLWADIAQFTKE